MIICLSLCLSHQTWGCTNGGTHTQNVVKLLNDSQYDEALILVDSLRIVYRSEDSLVLAKKIKTEEDVYVHECDSIVLYQLEWLRIQSLIGQKNIMKSVNR